MGTTKKRDDKQKEAAVSFLSNITLGNEQDNNPFADSAPLKENSTQKINKRKSDYDATEIKLTLTDDTQRSIASEIIHREEKENSLLSVFRYYKTIIRQPKRRSEYHHGHYHNQHIFYHSDHAQQQIKYKKKKQVNPFISDHPVDVLSVIQDHYLHIHQHCNLELSVISHALVYVTKLLDKMTVENQDLLSACCLFLAVKAVYDQDQCKDILPLLQQAMDQELHVDPKQLKQHEFSVYKDLEFDLFVPMNEFMSHLNALLSTKGIKNDDNLGVTNPFYAF